MFRISDSQRDHNCEGFTRRDFLRIGTLGLGGLTLPGLLEAQASGVPLRGKSVVLLFLHGGAPHIEFFDPKMSAPAEVRSITGEIPTRLPGVTFGSTFPKLAKLTDKLAVVRNFASKNGGHTYEKVATGNNPTKAAMSAIYSRIAGANNPTTGMPNNILVKPESIQPDLKLGSNFETGALPSVTQPGELGEAMRAFDPSGGGQLQQDMEVQVAPERFLNRRGLLGHLDRLRRETDVSGNLQNADRFRQQAYDMLSQGITQAFDLSREDPKTLARYDTTHLFDAARLQKWYDMRRATNLLGHQMLLARRLCEAGCGFVTVSDCGWDFHANNNSPKNMAGIWPMGGQVDHAVSTFIEDVYARGLQDDILLVVTSEMGRSPKLNKTADAITTATSPVCSSAVAGWRWDRLSASPTNRRPNLLDADIRRSTCSALSCTRCSTWANCD